MSDSPLVNRLAAVVQRLGMRRVAVALVAPLVVLAVVIAAERSGSWTVPVAAAVALYYLGAAILVLADVLRRRRRSSLQQQTAPVPEVASAPATPVVVSRALDRSPSAQRARMLAWLSTLTGRHLLISALLSKSAASRDVLARLATSSRLDYAELVDAAHLAASAKTRMVGELLIGRASTAGVISLARAVHGQNLAPTDRADALALLAWAARHDGFSPADREVWAAFLIQAGRLDEAAAVIADLPDSLAAGQLAADVLNPFTAKPVGATEAQWLRAFNAIFAQHGLDRMSLAPASGSTEHPFDRLEMEPVDGVPAETANQPLVTVICAAFNPGRDLVTAVRSVIGQTWSNWELLIVDDGSAAKYRTVFDQCAAMDTRVRVIRRSENAGTYVCRNAAIDEALGEFVTVHDSDDWMHPRRLELQARHLMEHPDELANVSYALRLSQQLSFVHDRGYDLKLCEPSLFFRREACIASAGYFDSVRAGADSEYRNRLGEVQGTPVTMLSALPPLTLQRFTVESLSGTDFGYVWLHPARLAYRSAWRQWHESLRAAGTTPSLAREQQSRSFPAPDHLSGAAPTEPLTFDDIVVLDFAERATGAAELAAIGDELAQLARSGRQVAVVQCWSLGESPVPEYRQAAQIQRLINAGTVQQIFLETTASAHRLIIRQPQAIQFAPELVSGITADTASIVNSESSDRFVRAECERSVERVFGVAPQWMPARDIIYPTEKGA